MRRISRFFVNDHKVNERVTMPLTTTARKVFFGAILLIASTASPATAATLLPPGHVWEYTFIDPTADSTWNATTGLDNIWSEGPAPFGNNTGGFGTDPLGQFDFATFWAADGSNGDDLWVRTSLDLTDVNLSTVLWSLGVDNGFKLYANGTLITAANAEGYTFRWEYTGDFGNTLEQRTNVLAVALEDHGGLTAFDMEITGNLLPITSTPVPEPATGAVLAIGLISFIGFKLANWSRDHRLS